MKKETQQKLESFFRLDSWRSLHPSDMERFYEFVIEAYNNGDTEISKDKFLEVVNPFYKMNEDKLEEWKKRFENGIELLKVYNKNS